MLIAHPEGNYRFLVGIEPYSSGVIAEEGYEIVRAVLEEPLPWRRGFERIEAHLRGLGRGREALCGVELRSPAPFTLQGFIDFNRRYCALLEEWDLFVEGKNPVARTHVVPLFSAPPAPALHAFSYTVPASPAVRPTLIVAGAGELRGGLLEEERILRPGDTSPEGMRIKASYVMEVMEERLKGLGGDWNLVGAVGLYTVHLPEGLLEEIVLPRLGAAARRGIRWHWARPPVQGVDFEMDLRGVRTERLV